MCDASYIPAHDSKGQLWYAMFLNLNSGAIEAKSCKDSTVSTLAAHVDLKAMYLLMLSIIWTRGFLMELGFEQHEPGVTSNEKVTFLQKRHRKNIRMHVLPKRNNAH